MLGNLAVLRWRALRMDARDGRFMEGAKFAALPDPETNLPEIRANQFVAALSFPRIHPRGRPANQIAIWWPVLIR
jgi:hypothetical protein